MRGFIPPLTFSGRPSRSALVCRSPPPLRQSARRARWVLCDAGAPSPSLAHRLASAFIDACSPGRKPYATALREFCDTALAAYREGYSLQALQMELATSGASAQALRALQSDEVELRAVWLSLVYKTLRVLGYPAKRSVEAEGKDGMDEFVGNIVNAVRMGYDIKRIQLEQSLSQRDKPRTTLESAILGQSTRLVVTTISAANEDMQGRQGESGGTPAIE